MSPPLFPSHEQIDRYLTGHSSAEEHEAVERVLRADPAWEAFLHAAHTPVDVDKLWKHVEPAQPAEAIPSGIRRQRGNSHIRVFRYTSRGMMYAAGAVFTCIFAVAVATRLWHHGTGRTQEYVTHRAERQHVTLPDGSHVVLGPETRLRYATTPTGSRELTLQGQAYFTVVPDPAHAFVVRTGTIQTRVLGTSFDVQHYASQERVQVSVTSGKVVSGRDRDTRILTPGMMGEFTDSTARVTVDSTLGTTPSWVGGRLVFTDVPVSSVLQTLQRWYDYEFRLADTTLATRQVTARFTVNDPERTMVALKALLDVTLTARGRVITLHPKKSDSRVSEPLARRSADAFAYPQEAGK